MSCPSAECEAVHRCHRRGRRAERRKRKSGEAACKRTGNHSETERETKGRKQIVGGNVFRLVTLAGAAPVDKEVRGNFGSVLDFIVFWSFCQAEECFVEPR